MNPPTSRVVLVLRLLTALFCLVFCREAAGASPELVLRDPGHDVPDVEVLEDPDRAFGFADVSGGRATFGRPGRPPNVGYSSSAFWIRFKLTNPAAHEERVLLEILRNTDFVDLYELRAGGVRHRRGGGALPFGVREVPDADHVFRLTLAADEHVDCYVRFESADTLDLTPQIWSEPAFQARSRTEGIAGGVYFGLMLGLILYNFFVFVSTRVPAYGFYVLFQICYAGMQAAFDRYLLQYFWPDSPAWAARTEIVFGAGALAFGALFARAFLDLPAVAPRLARTAEAMAGVAGVLTGLGIFTSHTLLQQATLLYAAISTVVVIFIGAGAWLKRSPNAPYYTVAYGILALGTVVDASQSAGLASHEAVVTLWLRVGSGAEALLLAFGLANRINVIQREKDRAARALADSRNAYARTLEQRVAERTSELVAALQGLETAQRELAQRERLAALGRMVAGVAHEVMNPLNFSVGGAAKLRSELERVTKLLSRRSDADAPLAACATADRALKLVEAGNLRIAAIIGNLRGYVRLGRVPSKPTDLNEEIERVLQLSGSELSECGVTVEKQLGELPEFPCREGELGQVFMNLIQNARQAMPDGGTLAIVSSADPQTICISVKDTGPGVPPEHREAIFEPFFTTRPPGQGTGLGLSLSHEIVERHGGRLELVPSESGAEFRISLRREGAT